MEYFLVWWITIVVGGIKFEVAFICFKSKSVYLYHYSPFI